MAPAGTDHGGTVGQLSGILIHPATAHAQLSCQLPLRSSDISEPEPDFALVKPRADFYKKAHPGPTDTLLVVGVSASSLGYDTQIKAPLYALHAIPELLILDLTMREIRFFRSLRSGPFTDVTTTSAPGRVLPGELPEIQIDLTHIFDE